MLGTLDEGRLLGSNVTRTKGLSAAFLIATFTIGIGAPVQGVELSHDAATGFALALTPNDPCVGGCPPYGIPWHFDAIGAHAAWEVTTGAPGITIAIVDTGVDDSHPDLTGRVRRIPGCGLGPTAVHSTSHGTFIAGLIGAISDNAMGTAGLDWKADLLDVRVMNGASGNNRDIADGIRCAANNGADIITLSFVASGTQLSAVLKDAIDEARAAGVLVIAAAGNDGGARERYPAAAAGVLSVGAIDETFGVASFSNRGTWIDVMAPGVNLLSLGAGASSGVRLGQGTSFAAPLVAATASLVKARFPYFDASQIYGQLVRTAQWHTDLNTQTTYRLLNAEQAVSQPYRTHWQVTAAGKVLALGESQHFGDLSDDLSVEDVVAIAANASGLGYWVARSNGVVSPFGDALSLEDLARVTLNRPIVGMAATPSGNGYWLVASDGGIFSFGDAGFHGSTGAMTLNQPITSLIQTRLGYDLVAKDGGVFNFNSPFVGSGASSELYGSVVDAASRVGGW
ncbi:MAG: S8 family serine peptidase [Actinomycetota bacterium]|nr:S8 family serine peptidase [Actinomycetota bacterium]